MKISAALLAASLVVPSTCAPVAQLIGQGDLGFSFPIDANEDRHLQSACDQLKDNVGGFLTETYGFGFSCSCTAGSTYTVTCNSNGQPCCGDICGTVQRVRSYTSNLDDIMTYTCISCKLSCIEYMDLL